MLLKFFNFQRKKLFRCIVYFLSFVLIAFGIAKIYCRIFLPNLNYKSYTTASFEIPTAYKPNLDDESLIEFKIADRLLPNYMEILSGLGGAYLKTGQKEMAIKTFEAIIKIEPKNLIARNTVDYLKNL